MSRSMTTAQIIEIAKRHAPEDTTINYMVQMIAQRQHMIADKARRIRVIIDSLEMCADPNSPLSYSLNSASLVTFASEAATSGSVIWELVAQLVPMLNERGEEIEF